MSLLYKDLSYALRGCIYEAHNQLGTGFDEEGYQLALESLLRKAGIPFRSQAVSYLKHRGEIIHKFKPDLIIDDKIILELKAIETDFHSENVFQLLSYLKFLNKKLGMLVNFGLPKVAIKRIPFTEKPHHLVEQYDYIKGIIPYGCHQSLKNCEDSLKNIFEIHGLGYGEKVYRDLLHTELTHNNIAFTSNPSIPIKLGEQVLKYQEIKWPIINNQFVCGIAALRNDPKLDIIKTQTYLSALNLPFGLLAHFGKKRLELYGVAPKKKIPIKF